MNAYSVTQTLHKFNSGDTFVGVQIKGECLVIGETRNEEHAEEGQFLNLRTAIPLQEAIIIAKALLARVEEDESLEDWIEAEAQRREDYQALVDAALEHEIAF